MVTQSQHKTPHSIKINFSDEKTSAFAGLALTERLASRARLWTTLEKRLPEREGYDWLTIIKSMASGLLTGAHGTFATQDLRDDEALLSLLSLEGAPEEATVWRALEGLGEMQRSNLLPEVQLRWTRNILAKSSRKNLLRYGFFPIFPDGSLLEGSRRREGTKYIKNKGEGLMWSTVFAGPLVAAQRLAEEGEGEETCVREMLSGVVEEVLRPLKLKRQALVIADSLHGDGPTLSEIERLILHYIVGVNKLATTTTTLQEQAEAAWLDTGPDTSRGWSESGVCVCWLQCAEWDKKRTLIGRRWKREGEFIWNYSGITTDLEEADVAHVMSARSLNYPEAIWHLYDLKMGMETYYRDLLSDLNLHHPPCQELVRNAGFYAVATLAHTLATGVDLIGGQSSERGSTTRKDGTKRKRPRPRRMRLWRLRRRFFALPGRVAYHKRILAITLLGLSETLRHEFDRLFLNICQC
jgi:hypothetical protein